MSRINNLTTASTTSKWFQSCWLHEPALYAYYTAAPAHCRLYDHRTNACECSTYAACSACEVQYRTILITQFLHFVRREQLIPQKYAWNMEEKTYSGENSHIPLFHEFLFVYCVVSYDFKEEWLCNMIHNCMMSWQRKFIVYGYGPFVRTGCARAKQYHSATVYYSLNQSTLARAAPAALLIV